MKKKNRMPEKEICDCLFYMYELQVEKIFLLPLGGDPNASVYRVETSQGLNYFLKIRRGQLFSPELEVLKKLAEYGIKQVIAPLETTNEDLWTSCPPFSVIVYPYVEGSDSMDLKLSKEQWIEFGSVMKALHSANMPPSTTNKIPREDYNLKRCNQVKSCLKRIKDTVFEEPIAAKTALLLNSKREEIFELIRRTEELGSLLKKQAMTSVLCHGDPHGGNLLIDQSGALYLIDWDALRLAPKESDLMFIGAGIGEQGRTTPEEESFFYMGYGEEEINWDALCYYRYFHVVKEIGEYYEQIFLYGGGEDSQQAYEYLQANFLPNNTLERAFQTDKIRRISS
jgi:spectinomycin phosphotransferase